MSVEEKEGPRKGGVRGLERKTVRYEVENLSASFREERADLRAGPHQDPEYELWHVIDVDAPIQPSRHDFSNRLAFILSSAFPSPPPYTPKHSIPYVLIASPIKQYDATGYANSPSLPSLLTSPTVLVILFVLTLVVIIAITIALHVIPDPACRPGGAPNLSLPAPITGKRL